MLAKGSPDLLIASCELKDGDFIDYIKEIRRGNAGHNPFILIITLTRLSEMMGLLFILLRIRILKINSYLLLEVWLGLLGMIWRVGDEEVDVWVSVFDVIWISDER